MGEERSLCSGISRFPLFDANGKGKAFVVHLAKCSEIALMFFACEFVMGMHIRAGEFNPVHW
jgi:hypothetical protein